jgi:hypothetical protein
MRRSVFVKTDVQGRQLRSHTSFISTVRKSRQPRNRISNGKSPRF